MKLFKRLVFIAFVLPFSSAYALPESIVELLQNQKSEFERALTSLNRAQGQLLLERYTELLLKSDFTLSLKLNKNELRNFLFSRYLDFAGKAQESPQKKGKQSNFSESTESLLKQIANSLQGRWKNNVLDFTIDHDENKYLLPFIIDEFDGKFDLTIKGVVVPQTQKNYGSENRCLAVEFNPAESFAELTWLGTQETACPIPQHTAGAFLLSVAETIAKAAGKKSIILIDASEIKCEKNRKQTSLQNLKLYQQGKSWYEQKGYVAVTKNNYLKTIQDFRAYPLKTLLSEILQLNKNPESDLARQILSRESETFFQTQHGSTVAEFMAWLWETDCVAYIEVDDFIRDPGFGLQFAKQFPDESAFRKDF